MRISDWSSDVCSSDLQIAAQLQSAPVSMTAGSGLSSGSGSTTVTAVLAPEDRALLRAVASRPVQTSIQVDSRAIARANDQGTQLGRATRRERVCQYVLISVRPVSFKKKINYSP